MIIYDVLQHHYDNRRTPETARGPDSHLKTTEVHVLLDNPPKNTINTRFKRHETHRMFSDALSCTDTKTPS